MRRETGRATWVFPYDSGEVLAAARKKVAYHQERVGFWEVEREKADRELRDKGIDLREHPVSGGYRLQPVLDPERAQRLLECEGKVKEHTEQRDIFRAYCAGLKHAPGIVTLELDVNDIEYFGLIGAA